MVDYDKRIQELEAEIKKTQYNKATQHHIGKIKARIAQLKKADAERSGGTSGGGYSVRRSGDATVILLGFPSTGKSTILNALTNADSPVGAYAFTTLDVIPGQLNYEGAQIQVLDVPGIVAGAASGKGRGKEVLSTMRSADLAIIVLDGTRPEELEVIKQEVYGAGIRLDQQPPDVKVTKKSKDGIDIGRTVRTPELTNRMIIDILSEFRIFNADVVIRSKINADQFIDVLEANKKYMTSMLVINKEDLLTAAERKKLTKELKPDLFISANEGKGIEKFKKTIFKKLNFIRIWMKEPGKEADMDEPLIMPKGTKIKDAARKIHRDFEKKFKSARVTGPSAKFPNQRLGLEHTLKDNDILEMHMR